MKKEKQAIFNILSKNVKNAFGMRRKTLRNCLKNLVNEWRPDDAAEILASPLFDKRAEQLSVQEFIDLTVRLKAPNP